MPPASVDREGLCDRLLRERAGLTSNLNRFVRADAEILSLFRDAGCVNALLLWSVHEIQPKNYFLLVGQNNMEAIPVIPTLRLVNAAIESLKRVCGRRGLPECDQR